MKKSSIKADPINVNLELHLNRNQKDELTSGENVPDIRKYKYSKSTISVQYVVLKF